jgi:hypothetical protein
MTRECGFIPGGVAKKGAVHEKLDDPKRAVDSREKG